MKRINNKNLKDISKEWDDISQKRFDQIKSDLDSSYNDIIVPTIIKLLTTSDLSNVLDCGCGVGFLTKKITNLCKNVVGIDISKKSIEIAIEKNSKDSKPQFINASLHDFSKNNIDKFSICIANMVLMNIIDLPQALIDIGKVLKDNGELLISIIHPCFWSTYWNYFNEEWFNYHEEIIIEADFCITKEQNIGQTTHVHRSLSKYINNLTNAGFVIENFVELPQNSCHYPRFLFIKCRKSCEENK